MKKDVDLKSILGLFKKVGRRLKPYIGVLFFLLFACVYSFVILRINALNTAAIDSEAVNSQIKASPIPHIDPKAVKQLQTLRDNSVNVQTLFEQGRTNPFQE